MTHVSEGAIPERLTTTRLVLRRVVPSDVDAMVALHSDPDATRHRPEGAGPPEHSRQLFMSWLDHWTEFRFGYWAIELVATGELVGFGGLQLAYADEGSYLNVFYRLFPRFWGHGYAPEMVTAALDWGHEAYPRLPILIITPTTNTAARRVAEKLGATLTREEFFQGALSCFYELPR